MCEGEKAVVVGLVYMCRIFFLLCLNLQHNESVSVTVYERRRQSGYMVGTLCGKKGPTKLPLIRRLMPLSFPSWLPTFEC